MTYSDWRVLNAGPADRAVLAIDFGLGRAEAGFSDLIELLSVDCLVLEPLFDRNGDVDLWRDTDPEARVRSWVDDLVANNVTVHGVLGYCAGGPLACLAADRIREIGCGDPKTILLDANWVTGGVLFHLFSLAIQGYAELLSDEQYRATLDSARAVARPLGGDPLMSNVPPLFEAVRGLSDVYASMVGTACDVLEVDDEVHAELLDRFTSFITYLATSARVDPRAVADRGTTTAPEVFVSDDYELPEIFGEPTRRFAITHATFLNDQTLAKTISDLLT